MAGGNVFSYARHQPEHTLLYQLIERYWPEFQSHLSETDRCLPRHVAREFDEYLECGRLENGFLRVRCEDCHHEHLVAFSCKRRGFCPSCGARRMAETAALLIDDVLPHKPIRQWVLSFPYPLRFLLSNSPQVLSGVLGIVNRAISTYLIKKAGFSKVQARTGAVTLIQCFGSALNLNVHFHMLFIDGAYQIKHNGQLRFHRVNAPTASELNTLVAAISQRVAGYLERQGLLVRDDESSYLTLDLQDDDAMSQLQGHSITYRIAVGPQQGRKVFTLQTIPSWEDDDFGTNQVGKIAGFSLHAGVATKTRERRKLERLCRYISRPAVSEKRLALTSQGNVRYQLKTPYRDGTTHVIFEPLDFIAKLAALVPKPRANLTRYHGVLAPNSKQRIYVTPAQRGKGNTQKQGVKADEPALVDCHQSMTWAERLKRVFNIDITICSRCGGAVRIIACIEDPLIIKKILAHLDANSGAPATVYQLPEPRAPPQATLFE
jgi:ribosomal protein S27E